MADGAVNINRLPVAELSVAPLASKEKPSKCWDFFGKLIHTKDGKRKHIACDKVFCVPCLKKAQELPKVPKPASNQLQEEDVDVDDPLPLPVVHELFGSFAVKSYSLSVSTGNLARHLKDDHGIDEVKKTHKNATLTNFFSLQRKITGTLVRDDRWFLARDLTMMCCRDLFSFDFVCGEGMVDFCKVNDILLNSLDSTQYLQNILEI